MKPQPRWLLLLLAALATGSLLALLLLIALPEPAMLSTPPAVWYEATPNTAVAWPSIPVKSVSPSPTDGIEAAERINAEMLRREREQFERRLSSALLPAVVRVPLKGRHLTAENREPFSFVIYDSDKLR